MSVSLKEGYYSALMYRVVRNGFSEELALKARSEGQGEAHHVNIQKSFPGRRSMCREEAEKSLALSRSRMLPRETTVY